MSDYLTNETIAIIEQLRRVEAERDAVLRERDEQLLKAREDVRRAERSELKALRERDGLLRQIDEIRRLKEDEDTIAVSQQFDGNGPWVVHGRNGNRQPKIAYFETREQAEDCAHNVRRVIAEALAPYRKDNNA